MSSDECLPITPADIKRAVVNGHGVVYVNMIDGKPWITDSFWAAPLTDQLAAFAAAYGIDDQPGAWFVSTSKTAWRMDQDPPNIDRVVPPRTYTVVELENGIDGYRELRSLETPETGKQPVFVNPDTPAIVLTDGVFSVGASIEYLRVLAGGREVGKIRTDHGLSFHVKEGRSRVADHRRVRIFAKGPDAPMIVVVERQSSSTKADTHETSYRWDEMFRAVLMPVRLGAAR